jgi:hypothetical protein
MYNKLIYSKHLPSLQSETIDWLRFPLVICVVFIHNFGLPEMVNMQAVNYFALSGVDIYNIIRVLVRKIASICNPCFFLFSGFLFFLNINQWNKGVYFKKLKSRIKTLLIPYILWNLINVLIRPLVIVGGRFIKRDGDWGRFSLFFNELFDKGVWSIFWHYNTWGTGTNILGWSRPSMGPFSIPMWFLQTLIVLSLLTPVIYCICKYLKQYGLIILGIAYYTGIWFSIPGFSISPLFFFSIGAYLGIYKKNLIVEFRRYTAFCYIIALITLIVSTYYDGQKIHDYFFPVFIFSGVINAVNIASFLVERKIIKPHPLLTQSTFFIYAIHGVLVLSIVGLLFDCLFKSKELAILILRYFTVPIVTAYVCVLIYCILKKIMPKLLSLLSGNR